MLYPPAVQTVNANDPGQQAAWGRSPPFAARLSGPDHQESITIAAWLQRRCLSPSRARYRHRIVNKDSGFVNCGIRSVAIVDRPFGATIVKSSAVGPVAGPKEKSAGVNGVSWGNL